MLAFLCKQTFSFIFCQIFQRRLGYGQWPSQPPAMRGQGGRAQQAGRDRGAVLRLRGGQIRGHI